MSAFFTSRLGRLLLTSAVPLLMAAPLALGDGCQPQDEARMVGQGDTVQVAVAPPRLETKADSIALQLYEGLGGHEAWAALPYLHFTFAVAREGQATTTYRHFWNRMTGDYRFERQGPGGEPYVVLFNLNTMQGQAYLKSIPEDSLHTADLIEEAHRRHINDSYWLLAPLKVFDEGVNRRYVADSSDTVHDVLHLSFGNVGLTPGDQYWLYVNKETGRLDQWAYVLEDNPDAPPRYFTWREYVDVPTPAGPLHLATQKHSLASPFAILTNVLPLTEPVPENFFTDPAPQLSSSVSE